MLGTAAATLPNDGQDQQWQVAMQGAASWYKQLFRRLLAQSMPEGMLQRQAASGPSPPPTMAKGWLSAVK